jgi:hypothetical protein
MRSKLWLSILLAVIGIGYAGWAQEQTPEQVRILVLGPESKVTPPETLAGLSEHLLALAGQYSSLKLIDESTARPADLRKRAGCQDASARCLQKIGKLFSAARVFYSEIQKLPGGRQLLVTTLLDCPSGKILYQNRQRVEGSVEALEVVLLEGWVNAVGPLIKSQIKVYSNVSGADVVLDGQKIGQTPLILTKDIGPGKHLLEVQAEGYEPAHQELQAESGRDFRVEVTLQEKEAAPAVAALESPAGQKLGGGKEETGTSPIGSKLGGGKEAGGETPAGVQEPGQRAQTSSQEPGAGDLGGKQPFLPDAPPGQQPRPEPEQPQGKVFYQQWWFWTIIGAVVAGGVGTTVGLLVGGGDQIPDGKGRVSIHF